MSDCIFCNILNSDAAPLYEDDHIFVIKDIAPKASIHLLVITKIHIPSLADLTPADSQLITHLTLQLPKIATRQGMKTGFRTVANTGPGGGQMVPHLHFHLLGGSKLPSL